MGLNDEREKVKYARDILTFTDTRKQQRDAALEFLAHKGLLSVFDLTIYLSYPMTGKPGNGVEYATRVANNLRHKGYKLLVPHEILHGGDSHHNDSYTHADYVREDIKLGLDRCDAIALCPGWPYSFGCRDEFHDAAVRGKRVFFVQKMAGNDWLLVPMDGRPYL